MKEGNTELFVKTCPVVRIISGERPGPEAEEMEAWNVKGRKSCGELSPERKGSLVGKVGSVDIVSQLLSWNHSQVS